jgi:hypothetical protein
MSNSQEQLGAIRLAITFGKSIVEDFPIVAEMYFSGMTYSEIESKVELSKYYSCEPRIAQIALSHAIGGFNGGYGMKPYTGLIRNPYELEMMRKRHLTDSGKKTNELLESEGRGIGKIFTKKQRSGFGKQGAKARGKTPWIERKNKKDITYLGERDILARIFNTDESRYGPGKHYGQPNLQYAADEINKIMHKGKQVRTKHAIRLIAMQLRSEGKLIDDVYFRIKERLSNNEVPESDLESIANTELLAA